MCLEVDAGRGEGEREAVLNQHTETVLSNEHRLLDHRG